MSRQPYAVRFWSFYLLALVLFILLACTGCSTALNHKMPPWEVKRVPLTCDRKTTNLPPGLICECTSHNGYTWFCNVVRGP